MPDPLDALFVGFCLTAAVGVGLWSLPLALVLGGLAGAALTFVAKRGSP